MLCRAWLIRYTLVSAHPGWAHLQVVLLAADALAVAPPFHLQAAMDGAAVAIVGSALLQPGCQPIPAVSTLHPKP